MKTTSVPSVSIAMHRVEPRAVLVALSLSAAAAAAAWVPSAHAQNPATAPAPAQAQVLPDFAELAERVGPAVVNIRTTERVRARGGMPEMDEDIEIHHEEGLKPAATLNKVGDAMPGMGIVAAVLGVVITMGAIDGPPAEIGHKVGAALVGTFLGILLCYGFIGPMATFLEHVVNGEGHYTKCLKTGLLAGDHVWERPEPELVRACAAFKAAVCLADPHDRGARAQLNLGHTFAHALEAAAGYALPHGSAVALGLLAALRLSGLPDEERLVEEVLAPERVAVDEEVAWAALALVGMSAVEAAIFLASIWRDLTGFGVSAMVTCLWAIGSVAALNGTIAAVVLPTMLVMRRAGYRFAQRLRADEALATVEFGSRASDTVASRCAA